MPVYPNVRGIVPAMFKRATADVGRSGTTLSDDDDLVGFPVVAGGIYTFKGLFIILSSTANSHLEWSFTAPSGAEGGGQLDGVSTGAASYVNTINKKYQPFGTSTTVLTVSGDEAAYAFDGVLYNPTTAGVLSLQWCRAATGASATITRGEHSFMIVERWA